MVRVVGRGVYLDCCNVLRQRSGKHVEWRAPSERQVQVNHLDGHQLVANRVHSVRHVELKEAVARTG